ncbi:hypothetical protein LINGRAHAP2_LOCUS9633, partial [Linum grandiflorum]
MQIKKVPFNLNTRHSNLKDSTIRLLTVLGEYQTVPFILI